MLTSPFRAYFFSSYVLFLELILQATEILPSKKWRPSPILQWDLFFFVVVILNEILIYFFRKKYHKINRSLIWTQLRLLKWSSICLISTNIRNWTSTNSYKGICEYLFFSLIKDLFFLDAKPTENCKVSSHKFVARCNNRTIFFSLILT